MSLMSIPGNADQSVYPPTADFQSGTIMTFQQTAAPVGWVKNTTHNDKAFRVVSGTAGSGGANSFSAVMAAGASTIDSHVLSTTELPSHTHLVAGTTGGSNQSLVHSHTYSAGFNSGGSVAGPHAVGFNDAATFVQQTTDSTDLTAHNHSISFTSGAVGSGVGHSHTSTINVLYVDLILATKT